MILAINVALQTWHGGSIGADGTSKIHSRSHPSK